MPEARAAPGDLMAHPMREHMRGVVDLDFFVTAVRRLLRVAEQAKRSGCDSKGILKRAIKIFMSRWSHVIDVRDSLEHVDEPGLPFVPMQSSAPDGGWSFLTPGNRIDVPLLYEDAQKLCKVILEAIKPFDT
jgi:hypothetical protein